MTLSPASIAILYRAGQFTEADLAHLSVDVYNAV